MECAKNTWFELLHGFGFNDELISKLWQEINSAYSGKGRYYHTIEHIEQMLNTTIKYEHKLLNIKNIQLSVFYHDVVYSATKSDNEEKSADFAEKHLKQLPLSENKIEMCKDYIIATKNHANLINDSDLNHFLDFDLEKLGSSWLEYEKYTKQIRQEYKIYPIPLYNKGRRKVLQHFLNLKRIFKTDDFFELYEGKARENLRRELSILS